jgi:hypothetical protein
MEAVPDAVSSRSADGGTDIAAVDVTRDHRVHTSVDLEPNLHIGGRTSRGNVVRAGGSRGIKLVEGTASSSLAGLLACCLSGTRPGGHHASILNREVVEVLLQVLPLVIAVISTIRLGGRYGVGSTSTASGSGALGAVGVGSASRAGGCSCSRVCTKATQAHCRSKTKEQQSAQIPGACTLQSYL